MNKDITFLKEHFKATYRQDAFDKSSYEGLRHLWCKAVEMGASLALWREPDADQWQLMVDFSGQVRRERIDLEELPKGFVIHPFEKTDDSEGYFLESHLHFTDVNFLVHQYEVSTQDEEINDKIKHYFGSVKRAKETCKAPYYTSLKKPIPTTEKKYKKTVKKAISLMKEGVFEKVVLSRNKFVELDESYDVLDSFAQLESTYSSAYVALVSIPDVGTWMCATPEVLVSQDKEGIFRTMALAGTQSGKDIKELKNALWRQKEIEEQALVSRYIINCFKKIRLREFDEIGPKTVRAGNLVHLRTEFVVDTVKERFPQLATVMIDLLHPTSAVCGMPKEITTKFILENEGYDREFYAGYLGSINVNKESKLYVHLRCMQILENQAVLYAGGGVTADSEVDQEWQETEMKCQTVAAAFLKKED